MATRNLNKYHYSFPAHSSLYHCIDEMIFTRHGLSYKIIYIITDENDRNKEIHNEKRLKQKLFDIIQYKYNERLNNYNLNLDKITDSKLDDLNIVKYKWAKSSMDERESDYTGRYMIYPKSFVCEKCGKFKPDMSQNEWESFDINNCENCDGKYEQVTILQYCKDCGKIAPLDFYCKEHKKRHLKLIRGEKDSLQTWKVVCIKCNKEGKKEPLDIFRFTCDHRDRFGNKILDDENTKYKPLSIKEGGIYNPHVVTTVDIPKTKGIKIEDLEYVLLGLYSNSFKEIEKRLDLDINLEKINDYMKSFKNDNLKELEFNQPEYSGLSNDEKEKKWKKKWNIDVIEREVKELKKEYRNIDLRNLNDYFSIKGIFSTTKKEESDDVMKSKKFEEYIEEIGDQPKKENYSKLKNDFGIESITYLPEIDLIGSCIGLIHGVNKFYDEDFVPHFNPIWEDNKDKDKLRVYSYPFETEGILIDLDKKRICDWLIDNDFLDRNKPTSREEALKILLKVEEDSKTYKNINNLLHTLSHLLIKRSSFYTGLDSESCSELIFSNIGSILIYSTSHVNIGGFAFVFEHSLMNWFKDIELDTKECTLDPNCIQEKGACFSCLYLPEFVCSNFNKELDRDVLIASTDRYNKSFW